MFGFIDCSGLLIVGVMFGMAFPLLLVVACGHLSVALVHAFLQLWWERGNLE